VPTAVRKLRLFVSDGGVYVAGRGLVVSDCGLAVCLGQFVIAVLVESRGQAFVQCGGLPVSFRVSAVGASGLPVGLVGVFLRRRDILRGGTVAAGGDFGGALVQFVDPLNDLVVPLTEFVR